MTTTKRPRGTVAYEDGDPAKKYPNGLRATIKSVRKFWPLIDARAHGTGRNTRDFAAELLPTYNEVAARYSDETRSTTALKRVIEKLEGGGPDEASGIDYVKMRSYAGHVGLPVGLLILFSQAVSYEAQNKGRPYLLDFVRRSLCAIEALEHLLAQKGDDNLLHFPVSRDDGKTEYLARLIGLKDMRTAFRQKKLKRDIRQPEIRATARKQEAPPRR
jgi:hypothetical protein